MTSLRGAVLGATAAVLMALASVSLLISYIDAGILVVMLYRNLFSALISAAILTRKGSGYGLPNLGIAIRGVIVLAAAATSIISSSIIGIGPATAILFIFPFFVYCATSITAARRVSIAGMIFCIFASCGVFLILFESDHVTSYGVLLSMISAVLVSSRIILDGKLAREMSPFSVIMWGSLVVSPIVFLLGGSPEMASIYSISLVFLASVFATFSQIIIMNAYSSGQWDNIGIYLYLEIPAAAALSFLIIGEELPGNFYIGIAIVFLSVIGFEMVRRKF